MLARDTTVAAGGAVCVAASRVHPELRKRSATHSLGARQRAAGSIERGLRMIANEAKASLLALRSLARCRGRRAGVAAIVLAGVRDERHWGCRPSVQLA